MKYKKREGWNLRKERNEIYEWNDENQNVVGGGGGGGGEGKWKGWIVRREKT